MNKCVLLYCLYSYIQYCAIVRHPALLAASEVHSNQNSHTVKVNYAWLLILRASESHISY